MFYCGGDHLNFFAITRSRGCVIELDLAIILAKKSSCIGISFPWNTDEQNVMVRGNAFSSY
jgi:hypothetical protein